MPHINEMKRPSKYVSAEDLKDKDRAVCISRVAREEMSDGEEKWVVYFQNATKGLALNQTNIYRIATLHGDHTDEWIGKVVTLTTEWTQDRAGKPIKGVRIRMPAGPISEPPGKPQHPLSNDPSWQKPQTGAIIQTGAPPRVAPPRNDMDDEIPF